MGPCSIISQSGSGLNRELLYALSTLSPGPGADGDFWLDFETLTPILQIYVIWENSTLPQ